MDVFHTPKERQPARTQEQLKADGEKQCLICGEYFASSHQQCKKGCLPSLTSLALQCISISKTHVEPDDLPQELFEKHLQVDRVITMREVSNVS